MSFLAYRTVSHDDFLFSGRRLYQHSITISAKHLSKTYRRAGQRCFGLLALISRPHVSYIHLPERMILPESLIPSDKYTLKNLTFVVRSYSCVYQGWRSRDKSRSRDQNFKVSVSRLGEKFVSRSRSNWILVSKQKLRLETSFIGTAL